VRPQSDDARSDEPDEYTAEEDDTLDDFDFDSPS
jgi:hypothetical protein